MDVLALESGERERGRHLDMSVYALFAEDRHPGCGSGLWRLPFVRIEGKAEGKAEGLAEGMAKEKLNIARNMKAKGADVAFIAECTGLSVEEIEKL